MIDSRAVGVRWCAPFEVLREGCVELLGLDIRRVLDGDRPALRDNLCGGIGTSDPLETRILNIVH